MKQVAVFLAVLLAMTITTNAQIPNGGFEDWITEAEIEIPAAPWITNNLQNKPVNVTYNPVTKSSDHFPENVGSYSIKLENNISFISDPGELLPYWACSYGFIATAFYPGYTGPVFPITGHPDSLCGYYKFLPQNNDTMSISIALFYQGIIVSYAVLYDTTTASDWSFFCVPIPAYAVADSAQIGFTAFYPGSGLEYPKGPYGNSILYIDNLSFGKSITRLEKEEPGIISGNFEIAQNYPNPFNPSTTIEFTLPRSVYTTLKVYNIHGAEVATPVSNELQAGVHKYTFDGSGLASGVYYYEVKAGAFRNVKKMILLR